MFTGHRTTGRLPHPKGPVPHAFVGWRPLPIQRSMFRVRCSIEGSIVASRWIVLDRVASRYFCPHSRSNFFSCAEDITNDPLRQIQETIFAHRLDRFRSNL